MNETKCLAIFFLLSLTSLLASPLWTQFLFIEDHLWAENLASEDEAVLSMNWGV